MDIGRLAVALVLLAWAPGHAWTLLAFPALPAFERFVYAVALSVALIAFTVLLGSSFLHVPLTAPTIVLEAGVLTLIPLVWRYVGQRRASPRPPP